MLKQTLIFSDFNHYAEMVDHADLEHRHVGVGQYHGSVELISTRNVVLGRHRSNISLEQRGSTLEGHFTFFIPNTSCREFHWRDQVIGPDRWGVLSGGEFSSVLPEHFNGIPIVVRVGHLVKSAHSLGLDEVVESIHDDRVVIPHRGASAELRKVVNRVLNRPESYSKSYIDYAIPKMLLHAMASPDTRFLRSRSLVTFSQLNDILAYIDSNLDEPLLIKRICEEYDIPERTLRYTFRKYKGMAPKRYINSLKYSAIHTDLRAPELALVPIKSIAGQYGFWHMGQFAADYKRHFGELPSDTRQAVKG